MEIYPYRVALTPAVVGLWNRALGQEFPLRQRLWRQQTAGDPSFRSGDALVAVENGQVVGLVLAKLFREEYESCAAYRHMGWISALVVDPDWQGRGIGKALLEQAEAHLRSAGVANVRLGGSFFHFLPGVPTTQPAVRAFFEHRGYTFLAEPDHDVIGDLSDFRSPPSVEAALAQAGPSFTIGPTRRGEEAAVLAFVDAEFPGRWWYETKLFFEDGGDPADVVLLREGREVVGFAHVFHPRSVVIGPSVYWAPLLGRRYGGLGPIGIAERLRGQGLGLGLLCRSLEYLRFLGVRRCVIDWTGLVDFYGKAGFTIWKSYWQGVKGF